MQWVCHNGFFVPADQPLFTAANRSFKWGDGLFETATFYQGRLLLEAFHFERLFSGLDVLLMRPTFTKEELTTAAITLCAKNNCGALARVRLAVYRDDKMGASFVMEATAMEAAKRTWNEWGWRLALYPFARKSCDVFSNLKSANYLPYVMAAQYAAAQKADEALVLNMHNRICDGSKTNLFLMNGNDVSTPALSEGGVDGVMRRFVIHFLKESGYAVHQTTVTAEVVKEAKQVFVTNAVEGLRWVQRFDDKEYEYGVLKNLYHDLLAAILLP